MFKCRTAGQTGEVSARKNGKASPESSETFVNNSIPSGRLTKRKEKSKKQEARSKGQEEEEEEKKEGERRQEERKKAARKKEEEEWKVTGKAGVSLGPPEEQTSC